MSVNPTRTCPICMQIDDHPRHVVALPDGVTDVPYHMDCHAAVANCALCVEQLAGVGGAKGNPKGDDLRAHLLGLPSVSVEHVDNADSSDPHNLTTVAITPLEG